MDTMLLKKIVEAAGISGYESSIAEIMQEELKKSCTEVRVDTFGNIIAKKGQGRKKIMLAAHMDEVGLMVKHITKDGFVHFIKIGGIDDRILPALKVIIKAKKGDVFGIIGSKPPHLQKEEERKKPIKYEDMFIDIGCKSKEEAETKIEIGDAIIFEPNFGNLGNNLYYGKGLDNRVGCFALLKIIAAVNANAEIYAVATAQEEVGLKGAKTASYGINPDFAIVIDTTVAGDTPQITEKESALKLGAGVAITIIEAAGRGVIVNEKVKNLLMATAKEHKIKYQVDVIEGGVTDGAVISLNREGILTGVLSIPTRYIHSPTSVFHMDDLNAVVELAVKVISEVASN